MAPGQLRQALAYGGTRGGGTNGSFNAPSSVPWIDGDEPARYQKQLRLQTARQRMLMDGIDAKSAAYEVSYESISQFSREYRRFFSQPPMRDINAIRTANKVTISVA